MGDDVNLESKVHFRKDCLILWYGESVRVEHLDVGEEVSRQVLGPPFVVSIKFVISVSVTDVVEETQLERHSWEPNLIQSDCVLASVIEVNFLVDEPELSVLVNKPLFDFFI